MNAFKLLLQLWTLAKEVEAVVEKNPTLLDDLCAFLAAVSAAAKPAAPK